MICERRRWHFASDSSQRRQVLIVDRPRNGSAHGQHQNARGRRGLHGGARQGQGQRHGAIEHRLLQPRCAALINGRGRRACGGDCSVFSARSGQTAVEWNQRNDQRRSSTPFEHAAEQAHSTKPHAPHRPVIARLSVCQPPGRRRQISQSDDQRRGRSQRPGRGAIKHSSR